MAGWTPTVIKVSLSHHKEAMMPDLVAPFKEPKTTESLCCRCGWHSWQSLATLPGMGKRGASMRRGCSTCGKIEIYLCSWAVGAIGEGWSHWGYIHPDDFWMGLDDIIAKYVPDHPSLQK